MFRVMPGDQDRLVLEPVLTSLPHPVPAAESGGTEPEMIDGFCSSLSADGRLWIPAALRQSVSLVEQNVMMRIENGTIGVYLRKVFDTLGFRP